MVAALKPIQPLRAGHAARNCQVRMESRCSRLFHGAMNPST